METPGLFRPSAAMNGNGEKQAPCEDCAQSETQDLIDALDRVHRSNVMVTGTILWAFIFVGALYVWKGRG